MINIAGRSIQGVILDMDGVLWKGSQPLADLPDIFNRLEALGLRLIALTNNSTRTPASYLRRLAGFGVELEPWQVINSSQAAAAYLTERYPGGGPLFVVGEEGLHLAVRERGFYHLESSGGVDDRILAVVAGMDRDLTYQKINRAADLIRSGKRFIGTNPDKTYPTPQGLAPGAGVVLAAIDAASGQTPEIMGKPRREIFEIALDRLGTSPRQTLMIGDRVETDILGARQIGCLTGLVFSGVTSRQEAEKLEHAPDLEAEDLTRMVENLERKT